MINISVALSMGGLLGYVTCRITSGRERIAYSLGAIWRYGFGNQRSTFTLLLPNFHSQ